MIKFDHFSRFQNKVYIKLTIIQGKNLKLKGEKLKLKLSAKSKTRLAENRLKKKAADYEKY